MTNGYSFKELEEPLDILNRRWEGYHARAIRNLLGREDPVTELQVIVAGKLKRQQVILDLVRAGVVIPGSIGSRDTVITRVYSLAAHAARSVK